MKCQLGATIGRLATIGAIVLTCSATTLSADSVDVREFIAPDGFSYYAISLHADAAEGTAAEQVIILFDTSASQIGEHRTHALEVLEHTLSSMSADQQVCLCAIDLEVVPLTEGFVAPSVALSEGLPQLESRFPAGATDFAAGIQGVLDRAGSDATAVLYIGDGMSTAHLIQTEEMRTLVGQLVEKHISFNSYAVGSNQDFVLLGVLAQHTGGLMLVDDWRLDATSEGIAARLASAVALPVEYPAEFSVAWTSGEILPAAALPMRADRDTIYLARGRDLAGATLSVGEHSWTLPATTQFQGTTVVGHLWQQASLDGGLSSWVAGEEMLAAALRSFEGGVEELETQAITALEAGYLAEAEQIAFQIQNIDPDNARADSVINAAETAITTAGLFDDPAAQPGTIVADDADDAVNAEQSSDDPANAEAPADPLTEAQNTSPDLNPIRAQIELRQARTDKLRSELENAIEEARETLETDPPRARTVIEEARAAIKAATDIDPDAQTELMRLAAAAASEIESQIEIVELRLQQQSIQLAEAAAQQRLLDYTRRQDQDMEMRADRIRALMEEGRHGRPEAYEEAEAIALQVVNMRPGNAIGAAVLFNSEAAGQLDKAFRLRTLRYDQFLASLYQVELAHVPFPDEPPIVYPSVARWRWITQNRAHWKDVDLHQDSDNERDIYQQLDQVTRVEFQAMPLQQAMEYIAETHNIPIELDEVALQDEGVSPDDEITFTISGITLKSALKVMLEDVNGAQLTYNVRDEIMWITSMTSAEDDPEVRVYPVGDFASPQDLRTAAQSIGGGQGGGGGFGGGFGGFGGGQGGGQGGGGGGGFGGGGGGFGGGGQGGGGGFFSIPDPEIIPQAELGKKKAD